MTAQRCAECGASVAPGGSCQDNFHALLIRESQIPGGPGVAHFYAVATYQLQHPDSAGLTLPALDGIRREVTEMLAGRTTLGEVRRRVRRHANGAQRVRRRPEGPPIVWHRSEWPVTVRSVLGTEITRDAYQECVIRWAQAVCETLDIRLGPQAR